MSAGRAFFDAIDQAKRKRREAEADDVEMGDYDDQIGDELADREWPDLDDDRDPCPYCRDEGE